MPNLPTDAWYFQQVATFAEEGLKGSGLMHAIEEQVRVYDRKDCPGERTIYRMLDRYRDLPEEVRREQALFRWPDAMVKEALPWEASRAGLDLLKARDNSGIERPTIRHVKWFWYLRLAAPSLPISDANHVSAALAADEFARNSGAGRVEVYGLDRRLAYEPWLSEANVVTYRSASARNGLPVFETWEITAPFSLLLHQYQQLAIGHSDPPSEMGVRFEDQLVSSMTLRRRPDLE